MDSSFDFKCGSTLQPSMSSVASSTSHGPPNLLCSLLDEHVDGLLDNEDERSLQEIEMKMEEIKEKDSLIEESQVGDGEASAISIEIAGGGNQAKLEEAPIETNVVVELYKGYSDYEQDDELVIGRGSLLEEIGDEGKHESQVKEYIYSVNNISRSSKDKDQGDNRDDKGVKLPSALMLQRYVASKDGVVSDHRHANNILTKELRNGKDKSNKKFRIVPQMIYKKYLSSRGLCVLVLC